MLYTHIAQWCFTSFLAPKLCIWNWSQEQGKLHFPLMLLFSKFYGALVYSLHIFSSHVTSFFTLLSSRFPSFLFGIFIFLSKNSTLISQEKLSKIFWVKNSWKCCGFGLFSCWQLWFHEKNCQKIRLKNSWKCWGFVKMEFLDKNLNFRIVCSQRKIWNSWNLL